MTIYSLDVFLPNLEPVCCSMSSSNCCFLTCIQISQEAGKVVWYSHLFKIFPQFVRTVIRLILQMRKRKHRRLNNLPKTALRRDHTPCPWAGLQTRLLSKSLNPGTGQVFGATVSPCPGTGCGVSSLSSESAGCQGFWEPPP